MLISRDTFTDQNKYLDYAQSPDFLLEYSFKSKSVEQVIYDLAYDLTDQQDAAKQVYEKIKDGIDGDFSGFLFNRYIDFWEEEHEPDWPEPDISSFSKGDD